MYRNMFGVVPTKEEEFINERIQKAKEELAKDGFDVDYCEYDFQYALRYDYRPQIEYGRLKVTYKELSIGDFVAFKEILKQHPLVLDHIEDLCKELAKVRQHWDFVNGGLIKEMVNR